jgi:hypothetical protein
MPRVCRCSAVFHRQTRGLAQSTEFSALCSQLVTAGGWHAPSKKARISTRQPGAAGLSGLCVSRAAFPFRMQACEPFAQTRRTNQRIKRTRRTVPRIPPPMYMIVSVRLRDWASKHAHENGVGTLTYQMARRMAGRVKILRHIRTHSAKRKTTEYLCPVGRSEAHSDPKPGPPLAKVFQKDPQKFTCRSSWSVVP